MTTKGPDDDDDKGKLKASNVSKAPHVEAKPQSFRRLNLLGT